jgi:hypothetical protein
VCFRLHLVCLMVLTGEGEGWWGYILVFFGLGVGLKMVYAGVEGCIEFESWVQCCWHRPQVCGRFQLAV